MEPSIPDPSQVLQPRTLPPRPNPAPRPKRSRQVLRHVRAMAMAVMPASLAYGLMTLGGSSGDMRMLALSFVVLGLLTPIVITRARTFTSAATAAGLLVAFANALADMPLHLALLVGLPKPTALFAIFAMLSALLCAANVAFTKRTLLWTQPVIAAVVTTYSPQITAAAMPMIYGSAVIALVARVFVQHHRPRRRSASLES